MVPFLDTGLSTIFRLFNVEVALCVTTPLRASGRVVPLWSLLEETAFSTPTEFRKSEHVFTSALKRATTITADVLVLCQRCGQEVVGKKVGHDTRPEGW